MSLLLQGQAAGSHSGRTGISRTSVEKIPLGQGNDMICNMPSSLVYIQFLLIAVFGHWSPIVMY